MGWIKALSEAFTITYVFHLHKPEIYVLHYSKQSKRCKVVEIFAD